LNCSFDRSPFYCNTDVCNKTNTKHISLVVSLIVCFFLTSIPTCIQFHGFLFLETLQLLVISMTIYNDIHLLDNVMLPLMLVLIIIIIIKILKTNIAQKGKVYKPSKKTNCCSDIHWQAQILTAYCSKSS